MDIGALEATNDLYDGIDFADVAEKLVAQALSLARALHQAGNVHEFDGGWNDLLRFREQREFLQTLVGHVDDSHVRFDRAEGKVCRMGLAGAGDRVKKRGFANIRQSDDTSFEHKAG